MQDQILPLDLRRGTRSCKTAGSEETDGQRLGSVAGMGRVPCVVANFLVSLFAEKIELVIPSSGVPGHHGLQRDVPRGSTKERRA